MRLDYLNYFIEIARTGSISRAAEKLNMTPQGLNRAIKTLESELDVSLYTTTHHGITLTKQGELLQKASQDILNRWQQFENDLATSLQVNTISDTLTIGITPPVLEYFLSQILPIFSAQHPEVLIDIREAEHLEIYTLLEKNELDLGLFGVQLPIAEKVFPEFTRFSENVFIPIYQYKISVVANKLSSIAKYKSVSMKTLLKYPLVLLARPPLEDNLQYRWLRMYGEPQIKYITSSVNTYMRIINNNQAVGIGPATHNFSTQTLHHSNTLLIPLRDEGTPSTIGYCYNKNATLNTAASMLIEVLMKNNDFGDE